MGIRQVFMIVFTVLRNEQVHIKQKGEGGSILGSITLKMK